MTSISTAILLDSAATPTAERACFPFSPKTATIKFEEALITCGLSVKFGSELTIPSTLTNCFTLLKSPVAFF